MKFLKFNNHLKRFFTSFPVFKKQQKALPVRTDWSKYLATLMQDQVDEILKKFEDVWIKEQCILKQQLCIYRILSSPFSK